MKNIFRIGGLIFLLFFNLQQLVAQTSHQGAVRVVVAGITHGHVSWILGRAKKEDMEIVGIYEPNKAVAEKNALKFHLDPSLFYNDLGKLLDKVKYPNLLFLVQIQICFTEKRIHQNIYIQYLMTE